MIPLGEVGPPAASNPENESFKVLNLQPIVGSRTAPLNLSATSRLGSGIAHPLARFSTQNLLMTDKNKRFEVAP